MTIETKFWTWAQIWEKIQDVHDLENETFVDEDEVREMANDAIDECEEEIHTLNQDYFLMRQPLADLEEDVDEIDLPAEVFAHKIRSIIFVGSDRSYEITRIPTLKKFVEYRQSRLHSSSLDEMRYFIVNSSPANARILLCPPPAGSNVGQIEIWHYRNANRLEDGEDVCDLPECIQYLFDYVSERINNKRAAGSARHQLSIQKLDKTKDRMIRTLAQQVPDGQDDWEQDTSHYEAHE